MSRPICAAKTCYNSYTKRPLIKFFPFPNDEVRSLEWIKNSGREDLYQVPLSKLSKFYLCSAHFEDKWFMNLKFKTKFKKFVEPVPTIFVNNLSEFLPKSIQTRIENKITKVTVVGESLPTLESVNSDISEDVLSDDLISTSQFEIPDSSDCTKEEIVIQCRLCASFIDRDRYHNILNDDDPRLKEMVEYICHIKIEKDSLPQFVCNVCESKVKECYTNIKSFEKNYMYFKTMADDTGQHSNKTSQPHNSLSVLVKEENYQLKNLGEDVVIESIETNDSTAFTVVANSDDEEIDRKSVIIVTNDEFSDECRPAYESDFESDDVGGDNCSRSNENNNKNAMIKCSSCTAEFNSWCSFKTHERQVHLVKNLECGVCCKTMSPGKYKKHVASHKSKENQCEYCGVQYRTKQRLEIHLSMHKDKPFCSFCGKEFKSEGQKNLHEKTHTDIPSLLCDLCGNLFFDQRILNNHIKSHSNVYMISCNICSRSFKSESDLKLHLTKYPSKFSCPLCSKEFHMNSRLQQHVLSHSNDRPFTCSCGISFNRKGNLSQHMKKVHGSRDEITSESFKCDVCKRLLKSKTNLKWHMAKHAGNKSPYECEHCEKRFSNVVRLKNHIRIHTGERPFTCSFCSKTFSNKENLRQHELIHQNIYRYHCTTCDRIFKRLHSLNIHKRTHSGERPFVCTICNKSFLQTADLSRHVLFHNKRNTEEEFADENVAVPEITEIETVDVGSPLTTDAIEFCSVEDIVSLTNSELQLLNMPLVSFQPLMPLSSNV